MNIKTILVTGICLWSMVGLTACGGGGEGSTPTQENTGGDNTGSDNTGGDNTGGDNTGGDNTGGDSTGGDNTGGDNTGGDNTGGDNTGGDNTGGDNTGGDNTGGDVTPVGNIAGTVSSEVTDIKVCQLYLYDNAVTNFADAFDQNHANFQTPSSPITDTAPISTSAISTSGEYSFENIETGNYKLVLNCLVGQDIQDESQLVDDPIQYDGHTIPNPAGITPNTLSITVTADATSNNDFVDSRVKPVVDDTVDVIVKADMTDLNNHQAELHDMWSTINRISPTNGVTAISGLKANLVRMLGGIKKNVDGTNVPDLDYDIASYNEQTNKYEYNFQPLVNRINTIVKNTNSKNINEIYQIVLDQPPWAFQRGHSFIPDDQPYDGISFKESQRVSHYGNSLPPKDKVAYNEFLQATINHLVAEYGEETVLSWRFRIGTEIETPDHWYGSEQDFVEHFANSVNAIRAVLPNAKIGLHTRTPNFVYKNGTVTNYKGEKIKSFASALIEYCYDNDIKYDFWGVSDYPFITQASTRDPKTKYDQFFKALVEHPKWQQGTVIDVEEYSVITRMGFVAPIYAYITSDSPQADTFNVALTDEFYQNNVNQVFQWGLRNGDKPWPVEIFATMFGKPRISADVNAETVGSVVVTDVNDNSIEAVTYHYDPQSLEAKNDRNVKLTFNVDKPEGTTFYYRKKLAAPKNHAYYNFMAQPSASGWLKTDKNYYNKYGAPGIVLNDTGLAQWENYQNPTPMAWTQWQSDSTIARSDGESGSQVNVSSVLPLFSFEKTQIKWTAN
ncbi:MAG: GH39 family glycosyl hydrolase [Thalassotalea sp.]